MADERVLQVQQWLNKTYGNDSRYKKLQKMEKQDGVQFMH